MKRATICRRVVSAAIVALSFCAPALAQNYPNKFIKIIAPYTPGSPNDVMVRLLAQHAQQRLGQPIIIDNRPGGGTSIGTKAAANSAPDGYTLLFISSALVTDPAMRGIDYDPMKDFSPVASVTTTSWLFAIVPSLPVRTMKEFIAHTRANPGTVNLAYAPALPLFFSANGSSSSPVRTSPRSPTKAARPRCRISLVAASRCWCRRRRPRSG